MGSESAFCKTILRRLVASRTNRPPVALSKLVKHLGSKKTDRTVVVVGTVTDDLRLADCPKLSVAALRFTEAARARIVKAGGSCQTIDELIMKTPSGTNTLLLRGPTTARPRGISVAVLASRSPFQALHSLSLLR